MEAVPGQAASAGGASHKWSILSAACQRLAPFLHVIFIKNKCLVKASVGCWGKKLTLCNGDISLHLVAELLPTVGTCFS